MTRGRYSRFLNVFLFFGDLIILNLTFVISYYLRFGHFLPNNPRYTGLHFIINLTWIVATYFNKTYQAFNLANSSKIINNYFLTMILHIFLIMAVFITSRGYDYSRLQLFYFVILFGMQLFVERLLLFLLIKRYRYSGYNYRRAIVIGISLESIKVHQFIKSEKMLGYKLMGYFFDGESKFNRYRRGYLNEVKEFCLNHNIDEIFFSLSVMDEKYLMDLIRFCDQNFIRLRIIPELGILRGKQFNIDFFDRTPVLSFRNEPLQETFNQVLKRGFDIVFSLIVILILLPTVFPIIALLIKLTSPGPIFFRQLRSGKNNSLFYCLKFRTMYVNEGADTIQATKGDNRITPLGRFLRKTNIDELPQFFNVLMGHMSVVGPRPHMVKHTEQYSKLIDKYMIRHLVKPGITGFAQIKGYRGETTDAKMMKKRVMYDVWYIENWYFFLDFYIVFMTVFNVIKGEKNAF